jgi:hypothetical protein
MKRRSLIMASMLLAGTAAFGLSQTVFAQTNAGWVTLLDGKNMNNWDRVGDANWRVEDGAIVADKGKGGFLVSKNSYGDFQIRAEVWVDTPANSGIFIRCDDPKKIGGMTCYEVNIFDTRPEPEYGTGAIVNVAKVNPMPKAGGKWNVMEIEARGPVMSVAFNGQKTVTGARDAKHPRGPFALQYGAGVVKFRKVEIRPL